MMEYHIQSDEDITQKWHIYYSMDMRCRAQSDGGIDYNGEYVCKNMSIPLELVVFDGDHPIGVSFGGHLFYFDDPETYTLTVEQQEEYVSGWGNVKKTHHYTLTPGPAPANSFPATLQE